MTDLFGDPVTLPSGRRGRPAHQRTQKNADKVILGLAMALSESEIAAGLHISVPTLRKYYFSELKARSMQRCRFELWRAEKLVEQANAGNVGAMKELRAMMEKRDRDLAEQRMRAGDVPEDEPKPRGKKEEQLAAAAHVAEGGSDGWGDLLTPGAGKGRVN